MASKISFLIISLSIGLAVAYSVVRADNVTLKTAAFELHADKVKPQ